MNFIKIRFLSGIILTTVLLISCSNKEEIKVASPNGDYEFFVQLNENGDEFNYSLTFMGKEIIKPSVLGFIFNEEDKEHQKVIIKDVQETYVNSSWRPVYGEKSEYPEVFSEILISVQEGEINYNLKVRAYNEGVAFRWEFLDDNITIIEEKTEFSLPNEAIVWTSINAQSKILKTNLAELQDTVDRPVLIQLPDSVFLAIGEAGLIDFARLKFMRSTESSTGLRACLDGVVEFEKPFNTPWRFIMAAEEPGQILENNFLILNLNEPNKIEDTSWIKPGKIIRETTLTTKGGKACVDFASKHNLQFVEFDAGWYGYEYDDNSDATTITIDPKRSKGPLDLHEVIRYAESQGIGIVLYVNQRALEKQLDEILPLFKSWGIKGVKYGFVNVGSQASTTWLHEAVQKAASYGLMVDIHDEYRPTGISRTYPNLMTQEGIRGDEESPDNAMVLNTIFTRMIAGAGDHTNCYFDNRVDEKMGSHASQLAKLVCIYSPWQFLYWYDRPQDSDIRGDGGVRSRNQIMEVPELAFMDEIPTVWDDTRVLAGFPGEFAVIARRSGDRWFIGALNGDQTRDFEFPLDFLSSGKDYEVTIYYDDPNAGTVTRVGIEQQILRSTDHIRREIKAGNGLGIVIKQKGAYDAWVLQPAPAKGDTILTDPPGFHWPQEEEDAGFILEISESSSFPASERLLKKAKKGDNLIPVSLSDAARTYSTENSYLIAGLPLPLHRPSFALGEGNWYWRRRAVTVDGIVSEPSPPVQFTISGKSIEYTVPPVKDLLNLIPGMHPRLFIRPENLDSLRMLLNTSEPHKALFTRISETADSLLLLPINEEPGPLPPNGEERYKIWRDYYDQARKSGQVLDFLSFCYMMTGEEKYAERARQWLLTFVKWDPEGPSSMAANDEVAMPILLNGARAYDWLYDFLSEEERSAIREMLVVRGEQAFSVWQKHNYHYRPYISHPTRLVSYMTQVGTILYGEAPEAEKWLSYLIPMITTFYPAWGGSDGGYSEGPSYWLMYFNYMLQSAHCIQTAMGLDILKKDFYRNSGWYKIYAYPYYAAMRPFGDTGIGYYWTADKMNLYRLASIYNNSYFRWRADMSPPHKMPVDETIIPTGIMSFFWLDEGPDAVQPTPPVNLPGSRLFQDIGLVAFHEDPGNPDETYFLFKSSPYGAWSHAYADQNSFYIQGFGEALAIQSGYYPHYGHPHHKEWTWKTDAHNSVLVDGVGQKIRDRGSRGEIIAFKTGNGEPGSVDYAAGDATEAYSGRLDKFIRHVYYTRPRDFLIIDELEAPKPVRFDWLLHSLEKMEIDRKNREVTIRKGEAMLVVKFISPENLEFSQTNKFSIEPGLSYPEGDAYPDQWHLTVSTTKKSQAASFIVKMRVSPANK